MSARRGGGAGARLALPPELSFLLLHSAVWEVSNLQVPEDVASSQLSKRALGPRRPGRGRRWTGDERRCVAPAPPLLGLQKSLRCGRRPPRNGPAPAHPAAAHPGPQSRRFRPPPCGSRGLPAAVAFVGRLSGPGDATDRQETVAKATLPRCPPRPRLRPEGLRPSARILPVSALLAAFPLPGTRVRGTPSACGRRTRLTYQE